MAKLIVWFAFSNRGWWRHDKYSVYEFVVIQLVTLLDRVEFLGG
jgi:hypothetical protein